MPHIVNGCGTWYYGKKNLQQYQGVCRSCGAVTTLSSYDTRLYVVVFLIPIVPLRAKRIIEQCAACTRHGAMPLDDWRRAEKRSADAIAAFRASPQNRELAKEAIGACAGFRNLPAFLELAPDVERHLSRDGETLRMLAAVYDVFGRTTDAERVLRLALEAQDEDETREILADCLMRQGRPHDAQPLLAHVVERGIPDRVDSLYQLAQGFQIKGEHDKALEVFRQCEAVNPHITQDETFVRLRDESAKHLGTHVPVQPGKVVSRAKRAAGFRKAQRVAPVVLALALVAYGTLCFVQGRRRAVYLVNGLHRPYDVRVNGQTHKLYPRAAKEVRVMEGNVTVEMVDPPVPLPAETATVRTSFFTRPFSGATFVINPDHAAILEKTRMYYQSEKYGSAGRDPETEYSAGKLLHRFDGVDYRFEAFPETLKMDSRTKEVARTGLTLAEEEPVMVAAVLSQLSEQLGAPAVQEVAKRHALLEPERSEYLGAIRITMKPPEAVEFLRTGLDRRPLHVNWHRTYQDALSSAGEDEQAEREYTGMLAKEPDNRDLLYLAGRATIDPDKALSLHRRAAEGSSPAPHAFFALCGHHLTNAQFDDAAAYAEKALQLLPPDPGTRWYCRQALLAGGRYDRVIAMLDEDQGGAVPLAVAAAGEEVAVRSMLSRDPRRATAHDDLAQAELTARYIKTRLTGYAPEVVEQQSRRLDAQRLYCTGDAAGFARVLGESSDPSDLFPARLTAGDVSGADKVIAESKPDANDHLLLYIAAARAGNSAVADAHLKSATEMLAAGDYEARQFAKALAGEPALPVEKMLRLHVTPREKTVYLAALGVRRPEWRGACFDLARKLNYDPRFPRLLLEDLFAHPPADAAR